MARYEYQRAVSHFAKDSLVPNRLSFEDCHLDQQGRRFSENPRLESEKPKEAFFCRLTLKRFHFLKKASRVPPQLQKLIIRNV